MVCVVRRVLEDLGDDDIALEPPLEVKTMFSTETGHRFLPRSMVLVPCRRLQDLLARYHEDNKKEVTRIRRAI